MISKLLPILLGLIGLGVGGGAGFFLRPAPAIEAEVAPSDLHATSPDAAVAEPNPESAPEYVKLSNQFVIPVLEGGRVSSMVILAISLEVAHGTSDTVYAREPKLRDALLQVLFDHANAGGFKGEFTDGANMIVLRKALLEAAQSSIGTSVTNVLINDIARQDS
jgi:flagellar protein FliL